MTMFLTIAVIVLVFVVIFQIAKASEYVSILKGEDISRKQNNKINGFLMVTFLVLGMIGVWYCNKMLFPKTLLAFDAASVEGARVDSMLWITIGVTGIVFIATQVVLFWFAYKYQEDENRKVFYFPHNNKLEVLWTIVPALVLTVLVVMGLRNWFLFTGDAPKTAMEVEVTGKQFNWIFRYPGKDGAFGKKYFRNIDDAGNNTLGILWDDPLSHDDIVTDKMMLVKGRPVKLIIGSRDVIHDVGLSQFRLKMDAVPGIPTTMWFTPKYTTKEMKEITHNPDFVYEISCDQMCGNGHFSMRGVIDVVDQEEYDAWMAKQKPTYLVVNPDKDPENAKAADSTKLAAKPAAGATKLVAKL
ncbi:MAG: cytochrome c oxidase subunit II [Bacteroidota bacterium]|nr:cytochrome c oxidase subunit II [Bacteroidota bacterium]